MKKAGVRIDYANNQIILYRWFAEKAKNPSSEEFHILSTYIKRLPGFTVQSRSKIRTNQKQERYKGLTYEYMRRYILIHEGEDKVNEVIAEFDNMILISECHSKRYPVIKNWFLEKYPEVKEFGLVEIEANELQEQTEEIAMAEEEPLVA